MWGAIAGLVEDGAALMLTTQYLEEADRLADGIVVLRGGMTVAEGTPAELKARSATGACTSPSSRTRRRHVAWSASSPSSTSAHETALGRRLRTARDDLRAALDELDDLDVEEASLSQPTLDDAFFALAGEKVG